MSTFRVNAEDDSSTTNMAAIGKNHDFILQNLLPRTYTRGDDVEQFIRKCRRFFKSAGYNKAEMERLIIALLDDEAAMEYEKLDSSIGSYEDRLRKAFQKPNTLKGDWEELLSLRKGNDNAKTFADKLRKAVQKVLAHKLDEESLMKVFLLNGAQDTDVTMEVNLRQIDSSEGILKVMETIEKVKNVTEEVNAVRSYSQVTATKPNPDQYRRQPATYDRKNYQENRNNRVEDVECWNCHRRGHVRSRCTERRIPTCYGCGQKGHIQRECPSIHCTRCNRRGHEAKSCYSRIGVPRYEGYRNNDENHRRNYGRDNRRYDQRDNGAFNKKRTVNSIYDSEEMYNTYKERFDEEISEDVDDQREEKLIEKHPNQRAPSKVEVMGAIC